MERLRKRIQIANKALNAFHEIIMIEEPSAIERDAGIQRFEFSFEVCWKAGKQYLYDIEGLDIGSPKGVIRACREVGVLTDQETTLGLMMVNDRNLTVHTYNEELSIKIFKKLPGYYEFLQQWIDHMNNKLQELH